MKSKHHGTSQLQSGGMGAAKGMSSYPTGKTGAAVVGRTKPSGNTGNPKGSLCGVSHGKRPASSGASGNRD